MRGRGGAGFPTGMKWSLLAKPEEGYLLLLRFVMLMNPENIALSKDRYLMERIPSPIGGRIITSASLWVQILHIYIRGEYFYVARILEQAIAEAYKNGLA